jgi:hypothetical protein
MKHRILSPLMLLALALGTCTAAYARNGGGYPEIDSSLAVTSLTLLAGAIAVLRVRRKK